MSGVSSIFGGNPYYPSYGYPMTPQPYPNNIKSIIPGRSVRNPEEISAAEVPMDGSLAIFPKNDQSAIYVKSYNGDGIIDTKIYIPAPKDYIEEKEPEKPSTSNEDILKLLDDLSGRVDDIQTIVNTISKQNSNRPYNKNQNNKQQKKGEIDA